MEKQRKTLLQLFIPICLETLLFMLAGMVDTLMLSSVSDNAVGAVGTANTYVSIFIIMFGIITSGMTAVMTQNIGAKKEGVAYQARQIGLAFNGALGVVFSIFLGLFSGKILDVIGISESLRQPAEDYLAIVGSFAVLNALIPVFSGYLRAFGYTKHCLAASITGNVINLVLNALFLYVFNWGVKGVAIATVVSRVINLTILVIESQILIKAKQDKNRLKNKEVLGQIIKIGLPSALETALYNVAMMLVTRFLNQMDAEGLNATARSYAVQISNFSYCIGVALAQANAIITGWRIGEKKYDECDRATNKAALVGIISSIIIASVFALSGGIIMKLFSDNPEMISLVKKLLTIDIILEVGRVSNLVYGNALKTSGDAVFPAVIAAIFMYLCAVLGTYIFGIKLNLLAVGALIGLAMDECIRAIGMFLRWRSGKWRKMSLVSKQ